MPFPDPDLLATLVPQDPDYRDRVAGSFGRQQAMQTLGITLERFGPGYVELAMPFDPRFAQQHGYVHGGIVSTALDSACGFAAFTLMPPEASVLTAEFKTNLIAPASGAAFRFSGAVLKAGRTLTFCEGRAFAVSDEGEKLIASITATMCAVFGRSEGETDAKPT